MLGGDSSALGMGSIPLECGAPHFLRAATAAPKPVRCS